MHGDRPLSIAEKTTTREPSFMPKTLRIATRQSELALWQARHVQARLAIALPETEVELLPIRTEGDRVTDRPLSAIGGKGLFLKELEAAMENGEADLAVHSMKDVPAELPPGFALPVVLAPGSPLDAFVSNTLRQPGSHAEPARWWGPPVCAVRR